MFVVEECKAEASWVDQKNDKDSQSTPPPIPHIPQSAHTYTHSVHCDGYCDSSPFMPGGRAATVVVFCEEAARGGQTSFTNADILVKGKAGESGHACAYNEGGVYCMCAV